MADTRSPIERVAVIGAGNMGSGIAQKVAAEGFPVVLVDVDAEQVTRGTERLRRSLAEGVERRVFTREVADEILDRITATAAIESVGGADLVIEAVFEDVEVKRQLFSRLDRACKPEAIFATNTSSLSVRDLARSTDREDRFLGLHYFYHPAKNHLVEVVAGEATSAEVFDLAWRFQEVIGKTPIRSADSPGFIVNRYLVPWLNESVRMVEEGVADIPTLEAVAKTGFGIGMGPFALMNATGIPIGLHAATTLGRQLGPFYEPAGLLRAQVERGEPWSLAGSPTQGKEDAIRDRLLAVTFLVAGQLVDEKVCTPEDSDLGARVGLRWTLGPFELMNHQGVERAAGLARSLADRWQLSMPRILDKQAARRVPFRLQVVRSEVEGGVATITVNRPDALNALNDAVLEQLGERVAEAVADPQVRGIVLTGAGKAFVAGADIKFFIGEMERGDLTAIRAFTQRGQEVLSAIDHSPKTVVCRLNGLALGGGAELALACDHIVASERAGLGFPETGIGIYPGLGGTQRTRQRVGVALTKYLVFTGELASAQAAAEMGLVDAVVDQAELEAEARRWALDRSPVEGRQVAPTPGRLKPHAEFFAAARIESMLGGKSAGGGDELRERLLKRVRGKAPLALRYAEEIIERGAEMPLAEGLRLELSHLEDVFSSEDALTGMKSVGRSRPEFQGR